jgi:thiol-disulfide isomerase/thioredoxin
VPPSPRSSRSLHFVLGAAVALLIVACAARPPRAPAPPPVAKQHLYAVLVNGGGRPDINYLSHLEHIRGMLAFLDEAGIPRRQISVFSGDGADPKADLATREVADETTGLWLLPQGAQQALRPPIVHVDSQVEGATLRPATKETLRAWFTTEGAGLGPDDVLFLYVTDHGNEKKKDRTNNTIQLWGEEMTVSDLREMLGLLDGRVRVVMLMSQCFSGAFANAVWQPDRRLPPGNVCGYFSTTADRPAYGCYPENRDKDDVGHSFEFLEALPELGNLTQANRRVLVTDDTPDVPNSTTDFFLERVLEEKEKAAGVSPESTQFVDDQLAAAWKDRAAWEPEIRLLDRVGHAFGTFSPRSLAELDEQNRAVPEFSKQLGIYAARWREALESLKVENLQRFLDEHPTWRDRLSAPTLSKLDSAGRKALLDELLELLVPFTTANRVRWDRLQALKQKHDEAAAARYRTEVRIGAILRLRTLLTSIAGRSWIERHGNRAEQEALARLDACQQLVFLPDPPYASAGDLPEPPGFPPLAEEERIVAAVMPAWMGIQYQPLPEKKQKALGVDPGAVMVQVVYPDSPAKAAGLEVGDVVLGPPGAPFREPNQVREWTMRSEIDRPEVLAVRRDGKPLQITLKPGPYPMEMPKLPGPPKVGSVAPSLGDVDVFRGKTELSSAKPRLLFFWATWCAICKNAVPELLAYAKEHDVEVVAVTDEDPDTLKEFFAKRKEPFPTIVAIDELRRSFQTYGVSGLPTFVLVGDDGKVAYYKSGYTPKTGLGIDGWKWQPVAAKP